jgi:hypothetical protein
MAESAAAARRGEASSRGGESGDGQTSGHRAQQEGPEGGVWQYEKINRIGEGTYGVVCARPCLPPALRVWEASSLRPATRANAACRA